MLEKLLILSSVIFINHHLPHSMPVLSVPFLNIFPLYGIQLLISRSLESVQLFALKIFSKFCVSPPFFSLSLDQSARLLQTSCTLFKFIHHFYYYPSSLLKLFPCPPYSIRSYHSRNLLSIPRPSPSMNHSFPPLFSFRMPYLLSKIIFL